MSQSDPSSDENLSPIAYCTILGGPNGSGKSTAFGRLQLPGKFVNADDIARGLGPDLSGGARALRSGKIAVNMIRQLIANGRDFVFETTLSSHHSLNVMRMAREAGYEVGLYFVTLNSPDLNVLRVRQRVSRGGHDIPEETIRRRYENSLEQLGKAIELAHAVQVHDNSTDAGPQLLLQLSMGTIEVNNLDEANAFHGRIAEAVGNALGIGADAVFRAAKLG